MKIEKMELRHIDGVMVVEHLSFTLPWSKGAFEKEITTNEFAHYLVAIEDDQVVGYAGVWKIHDEGHITNVAVHPEYRRKHIGSSLMRALIGRAKELDILAMTLEVRRSNLGAIKLYKSFGFEEAGVRKGYYADNKEDALVMWKEQI